MIKRFIVSLVAGIAVMSMATVSSAVTLQQFGGFTPITGGKMKWTNTGTGGSLSLTGSVLGVFTVNPASAAGSAMLGGGSGIAPFAVLTATLFSATDSATATNSGPPDFTIVQPLTLLTFTINRFSDGAVLLKGTAAAGTLSGQQGDSTLKYAASDVVGDGVDFSSAFADLSKGCDLGKPFRENAFSWTSSNFSLIDIGAGGYMDTGSGEIVGIFSNTTCGVPEPGTLAMLIGMGTGGMLLILRRRAR